VLVNERYIHLTA